jgi:hypothetical protein
MNEHSSAPTESYCPLNPRVKIATSDYRGIDSLFNALHTRS